MGRFPATVLIVLVIALSPRCRAADWTVESRGSVVLDTSQVTGVKGLSGVAYNSTQGGVSTLSAVQDSGSQVVGFTATFAADGSILSATAVDSNTIGSALDFEGITTGVSSASSVFLSEESTPGIREFDLNGGAEVQLVPLSSVFNSIRSNRGLESLTRSPDGATMWTANEEALTIDGPAATDAVGTTVRLQRLTVSKTTLTPAAQFAYEVEPVHDNHVAEDGSRSGLADLAVLPDGTILALERSLGFGNNFGIPSFESRIYAIDSSGATDISGAEFDAGLVGKTFAPVAKELLWSGRAGGGLGQNLEGLTIGPQLASGAYVLVGVVDDGDPLSQNTIVAFELIFNQPAVDGDFDSDGDVAGDDFLAWQTGFGTNSGALLADGDADGDADVDGDDFLIWQSNFGTGPAAGDSATVPEPTSATLALIAALYVLLRAVP